MRLRCEECERPSSPDARGWRLYLVDDPDGEDELILAAYCEFCWEREFGETRAERKEAD